MTRIEIIAKLMTDYEFELDKMNDRELVAYLNALNQAMDAIRRLPSPCYKEHNGNIQE